MLQFRYDIGFLRALAVVSVVLFHFRVDGFDGGFVGVDVFFVISGFLMTKLILGGFDLGEFNLRDFYFKRVRRIVPPLLLVGFIILLVSAMLFFNKDAVQNAKNVVLSGLFVSNIYYWLYNSYFDAVSQNNIFLHSWSLSVEWQFYIIYPLLLIPCKLLYLKHRRRFGTLFIFFTILSLLLCLWVSTFDSSFAFYMFPTRAWEMTIGGVAFLYAKPIASALCFSIRKIGALLGYLLIIGSVILVNKTFLWPSAYTLIPTLGTFLVIILDASFQWEKWQPLQFIGNISYSLYLWHWPVFIVFKYFGMMDTISIIYMVIISTGLAIITYYLIERKNSFSSDRVLGYSMPVLFFAGALFFMYPNNKVAKAFSLYDDKVYNIGNYIDFYEKNVRPNQFNSRGCFITIGDAVEDYNYDQCLKLSSGAQNVLLIGDSHAAQFSQSLHEQLPGSVNLIEFNCGMTFPFRDPKGQPSSVALVNRFYNEFLPRHSGDIDLVILSVHWPMSLNPQLNYSKTELLTKYKAFLEFFQKEGIPVLVVGQHETFTISFSKIAVLRRTFSKGNESFSNRYQDKVTAEYARWVKSVTPKQNFIDIYELADIESVNKDGVPYMVDRNHLSKYGADQVIRLILPRILATLKPNAAVISREKDNLNILNDK